MFSLVSSLSSYGSWQQNCTVTHSEMRHLDLTQPPLMKRPLRTFRELEFVCKLNVLVPSKVAVELGKRLENLALTSGVTRLTMSLHDVLTGIFFLKSFKNGKVMMISETDSHRDTIFVFVNGKLTMHVDKESYEKSGLVGKPESNCSQTKDRWIVEYDLTCKSMAPGKAGFERLLYACKNVYTEKRKWLYTDMSEKDKEDLAEQLTPFNPVAFPISFSQQTRVAMMPNFEEAERQIAGSSALDLEHITSDIYEWASLVCLNSPRIHPQDSIDPYLSRYSVPLALGRDAELVKFTWSGPVSRSMVTLVLLTAIDATQKEDWLFASATTLNKGVAGGPKETALLRIPTASRQFLMWEVMGKV